MRNLLDQGKYWIKDGQPFSMDKHELMVKIMEQKKEIERLQTHLNRINGEIHTLGKK